jgi:hypothetical protein
MSSENTISILSNFQFLLSSYIFVSSILGTALSSELIGHTLTNFLPAKSSTLFQA